MSRGKGTFEVPRLQRAEHRRHDADLVRRFGDCHLSLPGDLVGDLVTVTFFPTFFPDPEVTVT